MKAIICPFFLGANVFVNYFPANPTTWYIGFYLHMILFWAFFLHNRPIKVQHIFIAFGIENIVRVFLIKLNQDFTAYMMLTNWISVFLLGQWMHQRKDLPHQTPFALSLLILWLGLMVGWAVLGLTATDKSFPFRAFPHEQAFGTTLRSMLVSLIYLSNTWVFFEIFRRVKSNAVVRFFARNTIIIFIAHMLVVYSFAHWFYQTLALPIWIEKAILITILYAGIGIASEAIERAIKVHRIREWTWNTFYPILPLFFRKLNRPTALKV